MWEADKAAAAEAAAHLGPEAPREICALYMRAGLPVNEFAPAAQYLSGTAPLPSLQQIARHASMRYGFPQVRPDWCRRAFCIAACLSPLEIGTPFPPASGQGSAVLAPAVQVASDCLTDLPFSAVPV